MYSIIYQSNIVVNISIPSILGKSHFMRLLVSRDFSCHGEAVAAKVKRLSIKPCLRVVMYSSIDITSKIDMPNSSTQIWVI